LRTRLTVAILIGVAMRVMAGMPSSLTNEVEQLRWAARDWCDQTPLVDTSNVYAPPSSEPVFERLPVGVRGPTRAELLARYAARYVVAVADESAAREAALTPFERAARMTAERLVLSDELTDDEVSEVAEVFAPWRIGAAYRVGAVCRYTPAATRAAPGRVAGRVGNATTVAVGASEPIAYRCLQPHTANDPTHTPDLTPALWHPYTPAGQVAEWVQPYGGSGTYVEGTVVTHNGATWVNVHAAPALNVWEPGVYGWTKQ